MILELKGHMGKITFVSNFKLRKCKLLKMKHENKDHKDKKREG